MLVAIVFGLDVVGHAAGAFHRLGSGYGWACFGISVAY
jgi:hypothetical protein